MAEQPTAQFWDQRYIERGNSFGTAPNAFLASHAQLFKRGDRVLVPGDGEGRNGVWLAGLGLEVDTVDASSVGVANARALAADRGLTINAEVADLKTWNWPVARYDAVVSIFLHFWPDVRAGLHSNMLQTLKPGGVIVLEAYAPRHLEHQKAGTVGGPQTLEQLMTPQQLKSDFADAEMNSLVEAEVMLLEGTRHVGSSSVVRMIARRR